jgi:diketogulonate reductase-like aldo/keto reductase
MKIPSIKLADGHSIPQAGLGTWKITDEAVLHEAFSAAAKAGYRHFDTAQAYGNEHIIGEAWRGSGINRKDLFITTKIGVVNFGHSRTKHSFEESLKNLRTDYVDLLLLHFPVPLLRKGSWKALEEIHKAGRAKSIGVSNYTVRHLEELKGYAKTMPAVNQVELHVFLQQPELIDYCRQHDITVEAYSPLAHGAPMDDKTISAIAEKHGKTYAQIMLRWCVQKSLVVIPKSTHAARIRENAGIFEFKLDDDDMAQLDGLDKDMRTCWSPVHVP